MYIIKKVCIIKDATVKAVAFCGKKGENYEIYETIWDYYVSNLYS